MGAITNLYNNLKNFDATQAAMLAIQATADEIVRLNGEQMYEGVRADGQPITPFYTPFTVKIKARKGQPTDRVTLRDTKVFHESGRVIVAGTKFTVNYNKDPKAAHLEKKYSEQIKGLGDEKKAIYAHQYFMPELRKYITQATGLKFTNR